MPLDEGVTLVKNHDDTIRISKVILLDRTRKNPVKTSLFKLGGGEDGFPPLSSPKYWLYEKMIIVKLVQNDRIT